MAEGTLGFRATGHVTRDEYRDLLLPAMKAAAEAGEVRMVFAVGPGFEEFEPGALMEDAKVGVTLGIGHPHAWKRTVVVTDVDLDQEGDPDVHLADAGRGRGLRAGQARRR